MRVSYDPGRAPRRLHTLGDLVLESGEVIRDFAISYVTHGTLDATGGNAVLITSSIAGNAHRLDFLIGPGKALDPERSFIVATDAIGNGRSTSPSNSRRQPGMRFPRFSIRDMVASQRRLLEALGIERLLAVAGASMGGMQALQWGVSHPDAMAALVVLVPLARTPAWAVAVNETSRNILLADPAWTGDGFSGPPHRAWPAWVGLMQVIAGRTPAALAGMFPRAPDVLGWMRELEADWLARGFDAHDWLYQTWAYDGHDVGATPGFDGDTARALASIQARTLVMGPPLDLYNPAEEQIEAARRIPKARYVEIPSVQGHYASNIGAEADVRLMNRTVAAFLAEAAANGP